MSPGVLLLVLASAFSHALWNFFAKRVSGDFPVFWLGLASAQAVLLPFSLEAVLREGLPAGVVLLVLTSALAHAGYYVFLMRSYSREEISLIYPVARGTGVAGTALLAAFVLGERVSGMGVGGIALIGTGVLLMGFAAGAQEAGWKGILPALFTACWIIAYSVIDKVGASRSNPVVYLQLQDLVSLILLGPLASRGAPQGFRAVWRRRWPYSLIIGLGSSLTYLMILFAFRMERASVVVAVRESSVVLGALLGILFLKERLNPIKLLGILAVVAGLWLVRGA